jgi:hypothetical protein
MGHRIAGRANPQEEELKTHWDIGDPGDKEFAHFKLVNPEFPKTRSLITYIRHLSLAATSYSRVMPTHNFFLAPVSPPPGSYTPKFMNSATCIFPIAFPLPSVCVASPHPISSSSVSNYPFLVTIHSPPHIKTSSQPECLHVLQVQNQPGPFPIPMKQLLQQLMVVGHHFHHKWKDKE